MGYHDLLIAMHLESHATARYKKKFYSYYHWKDVSAVMDLCWVCYLDSSVNVHCTCRQMTQNEYIVPLTPGTKDLSLYRRPSNQDRQYKIKHSIPNMDASVSIRPALFITEKQIEGRSVSVDSVLKFALWIWLHHTLFNTNYVGISNIYILVPWLLYFKIILTFWGKVL